MNREDIEFLEDMLNTLKPNNEEKGVIFGDFVITQNGSVEIASHCYSGYYKALLKQKKQKLRLKIVG